MVNEYIQENPEQSMKIFQMIMPAQGIANALKNKSSEDVEEVEETEEVTTGSGVEERIREILKEAGVEDADDRDLTDLPKDLEAKVMSGIAKSSTDRKKDMIEASAIIGLSGPGRERKKMIDEVAERYDEGGVEEVSKPKFDYTKFFRKRRADGGAIGIEVLFEEKKPRKNFFMGGPALEGQALSIYNSMNAYGFSDQEIANALEGQGLYTPGSTPDTPSDNIIGSQINNQGGGGGIMDLQKTYRTLPGDPKNFRLSQLEGEADYFPPTTMMGKAKNFLQELSSPQVRGTLGTRMANQPKLPIPSFASFLSNYTSPFNIKSKSYNPLLESQLNFAETQEGIIGRDSQSGLLKYGPESVLSGKNVVSMFGTNDYEKMLQDYISKMNANKRITATTKAAKIAQAEAELKALQEKTEAARAAQYGKTDYGRGSDGQRSYSGDAIGAGNLGFGIGATTGGPVSNRTGRGRTDYSKGGLATMFKKKR